VQVQRTYRRCQCSGACMRMSSVRSVLTTSHFQPSYPGICIFFLGAVMCQSNARVMITCNANLHGPFECTGPGKQGLPASHEFEVSVDAGQ